MRMAMTFLVLEWICIYETSVNKKVLQSKQKLMYYKNIMYRHFITKV